MPTTIATSQNGKTMKVQSYGARNHHQAMLRRGVITGESGLACGRLIRIARVAEKPWDHRILIVATTERTMVRQITASVSIRQEPEHTRDQELQGCFIFKRGTSRQSRPQFPALRDSGGRGVRQRIVTLRLHDAHEASVLGDESRVTRSSDSFCRRAR